MLHEIFMLAHWQLPTLRGPREGSGQDGLEGAGASLPLGVHGHRDVDLEGEPLPDLWGHPAAGIAGWAAVNWKKAHQ